VIHRDDLWKLAAVIGGACVFWTTSGGHVPARLLPYKEWIETIAFVWTAIQAQRMVPLGSKGESK
jgi:hypothetical protein